MNLEKNKLTPRQARILQEAFKIILDFNNKDGDAYGNMRCELWTKESPFNRMFRISNSYDERGMLFDFKDIDNARVDEVYSEKEIIANKRNPNWWRRKLETRELKNSLVLGLTNKEK